MYVLFMLNQGVWGKKTQYPTSFEPAKYGLNIHFFPIFASCPSLKVLVNPLNSSSGPGLQAVNGSLIATIGVYEWPIFIIF